MSWEAVDARKQEIPLLDYLQAQDWKPAWRVSHGRLMGCARCTLTRSPASWWTPAKICFTG